MRVRCECQPLQETSSRTSRACFSYRPTYLKQAHQPLRSQNVPSIAGGGLAWEIAGWPRRRVWPPMSRALRQGLHLGCICHRGTPRCLKRFRIVTKFIPVCGPVLSLPSGKCSIPSHEARRITESSLLVFGEVRVSPGRY
jgi:hypothetical protein